MKATQVWYRAVVTKAGSAVLLTLALFLAPVTNARDSGLDELRQGFRNPPDQCRPMMRWWWFGPAVTPAELEREMRLMKEGGIGGFEVQPVYPLALDDSGGGVLNSPYLSAEFLECLRFASEKSRELGLRMDITLGSGWPFGGPHVTVDRASSRLRWERVRIGAGERRIPVPQLGQGEALIGAFAAGGRQQLIGIKDGFLEIPERLEDLREIWFFISSRTGQMVKRASVGGEGFVLDHYSKPALDDFLAKVAGPLLHALGANAPYSVFCDSLEAYGGDWTGDLPEQFRNRRGYDLMPWLPALASGTDPQSAAVRHDWGRTLTELLEERFLAPVQQWARSQGTRFRMQAYGNPPAAISSSALIDLSEGEGHQWKSLSASRWASSANHIYGRPVTSSETWTWLHSPVFRATPLDMKAEADRHFLQGINQLIGHGWPYSSPAAAYPGWHFYAAAVFSEKNPWWLVMPDVSAYLQRVSYLMRQGRPVNDVAIYLPDSDAWASFEPGQVNLFKTLGDRMGTAVVAAVVEAGYGFDFVDDRALISASTRERSLVLGDSRYRILILPGVETLPPATLKRITRFADSGGMVVMTRTLPASAPGLRATPSESAFVRETVKRLADSPAARFVRNETELGAALRELLPPDFSLSPRDAEVGFVHRAAGDADVYFIANTASTPRSATASFRVNRYRAELWNPLTGNMEPAPAAASGEGRVSVKLELEPYGSTVMVFSAGPSASAPTPVTRLQGLDLSEGWSCSFENTGISMTMDRLQSWADDERTRFYSGVAHYEKSFEVPADFLRNGVEVKLQLGTGVPTTPIQPKPGRVPAMQAVIDSPVREAAVVYVNGSRAGSAWCPPYSVPVGSLLKPGTNVIRISVGNLAVNHMAGRPTEDFKLLNMRYGVRFDPQDMDEIRPVPAGLLGPIRLTATSVE
jgi:hypothetical protein